MPSNFGSQLSARTAMTTSLYMLNSAHYQIDLPP